MIDEDLLLRTLRLLVATPSVSGTEATLAKQFSNWAAEHGLSTETMDVGPGRASAIVRLGHGERPHGLFSGHIDTLPEPGGTTAVAGLRGSRFFGPEVNNMKAAIAAMFTAMVALKAEQVEGSLTLLAAASECDTIGLGTVRALRNGLDPDWAINGEPTGLRLLSGHAGVARIRLVVEGQPGHVSQRPGPVNAIDGLVAALGGLDASVLDAPAHPDFPHLPVLNIGVVHGGVAASMAAPSATAELDVRWCPGMSLGGIAESVRRHVRDHAAGFVVRVEVLEEPEFLQPGPFVCDAGWPVVAAVSAAHERVQGRPCPYGIHLPQLYYGSDAPHLTDAGVPTCIYGPGETSDINRPDESIAWADVVAATNVYVEAARRMLAHPG